MHSKCNLRYFRTCKGYRQLILAPNTCQCPLGNTKQPRWKTRSNGTTSEIAVFSIYSHWPSTRKILLYVFPRRVSSHFSITWSIYFVIVPMHRSVKHPSARSGGRTRDKCLPHTQHQSYSGYLKSAARLWSTRLRVPCVHWSVPETEKTMIYKDVWRPAWSHTLPVRLGENWPRSATDAKQKSPPTSWTSRMNFCSQAQGRVKKKRPTVVVMLMLIACLVAESMQRWFFLLCRRTVTLN